MSREIIFTDPDFNRDITLIGVDNRPGLNISLGFESNDVITINFMDDKTPPYRKRFVGGESLDKELEHIRNSAKALLLMGGVLIDTQSLQIDRVSLEEAIRLGVINVDVL